MKYFALVLWIAALSEGSVVPKDGLTTLLSQKIDLETLRQARADASTYFDQVLANLREQMFLTGLNVISLPDQTFDFEEKVVGIIWHGTAQLYNGTLKNMDTIHRTGVADLTVEENGDIVIAADVGINSAAVYYDMLAKFMDLGPVGHVEGKLSRVQLLMAIRIDFSSMVAHLQTFNIKSTGVLSVDIKGLGAILNFLVEITVDFLGNLFKGFVTYFLEGIIKNLINQIISDILFPPSVVYAMKATQAVVAASLSVSI